MFENNLIAGVSGQGGGYSINDSLRFNDNDSAYLSRTPATAGNRKTWTWSAWVKRGNVGGQFLTAGATSISNGFSTVGTYSDSAYVVFYSSGSHVYTSPALLRDSSGWYHIVFSIDTTQSTASERVKFYVNGVRFDLNVVGGYTAVPQNFDCSVNNSGQSHVIGTMRNSSGSLELFFDGYLAEINFIDGQALTPNYFGEINATTGEWSPKRYSGTYGTNGFYLPFDSNANDSSSNGNNWTENNLASTDFMIDTPSSNFSVLNPLDNGGSTISNGNLEHTSTNTSWKSTRGTIAVNSGKWYWEGVFTAGGTASADGIGFALGSASLTSFAGDTHSYGYIQSGVTLADGGGSVAYGDSYTTNDIIGIALDLDAGTCTFYKNNVSQGQAFSGLSGTFFPFSDTYDNSKWNLNFGADSSFAGIKTRQGNTDANGIGDFYYAPPAGGYLALCTDNLPAPAIVQPETQFNVVTYSGDGTTPQSITGVGFQPDLVWIKRRDSTADHTILDVLRGDARLESNNTDAEVGGNANVFGSFDSDGFTTGLSAQTGASGGTYVAWCWKAGGTAVTNTDGAITSQVSANVDAGFSIVSYTATNNSSNVGHGLSQAPELIIFKSRTSVSSWSVYTTTVDGSYDYLRLNSFDAKGNSVLTAPSSSVMYVNNTEFAGTNVGSNNYIAYAFHSVESFSKIGSYVGNGSANGTFVYTGGFKPAFLLIKRTNSTSNWTMIDNERSGYNGANDLLYADSADAEYSGATYPYLEILSNGFKCITTGASLNASGSTYIYIAFAEHPFNYATGR